MIVAKKGVNFSRFSLSIRWYSSTVMIPCRKKLSKACTDKRYMISFFICSCDIMIPPCLFVKFQTSLSFSIFVKIEKENGHILRKSAQVCHFLFCQSHRIRHYFPGAKMRAAIQTALAALTGLAPPPSCGLSSLRSSRTRQVYHYVSAQVIAPSPAKEKVPAV